MSKKKFTPAMEEMLAEARRHIASLYPPFIRLPIPGLPLYTAHLVPDAEDGGFTVTCPEIPAAISQGETIEEALENIRDAVELCLEVEKEQEGKGKENEQTS